jgi:hypothetical protein
MLDSAAHITDHPSRRGRGRRARRECSTMRYRPQDDASRTTEARKTSFAFAWWRPDVRTSSARCPVTSRRYGGCSGRTPRARRCCSKALAASRPWPGGSPRATTRAPRGSSSRRSPSALAHGRTRYRPRRERSSCRTLPPSWTSSGAPDPFNIEEEAISRPVRHTNGSEGPPIFARVIDRLVELIPRVTRETIEGAAHVPPS